MTLVCLGGEQAGVTLAVAPSDVRRKRQKGEIAERNADETSYAGSTTEIKLAQSPDSDDAFMFYGLATQKVRTPGLKFFSTCSPILRPSIRPPARKSMM